MSFDPDTVSATRNGVGIAEKQCTALQFTRATHRLSPSAPSTVTAVQSMKLQVQGWEYTNSANVSCPGHSESVQAINTIFNAKTTCCPGGIHHQDLSHEGFLLHITHAKLKTSASVRVTGSSTAPEYHSNTYVILFDAT